jgi:hypothetical protein
VTPLLDVHPPGYAQAARTVGGELAGSLTRARDDLLSRLSASGGMGGTDETGAQWSAAYDDSAAEAVTALTNLADSAYCLAALLEQTAINYAGAEAASVPGEPAPVSEHRWATSSAGSMAGPPSAAGLGVPEPVGWSLLQHEIGRLWPNGHQDLLHASASAWHDTRAWLLSLVPDLDGAITEVMLQRGPEVSDATAILNGVRRQLVDLADHLGAIGDACSAYARDLDRAHSAILRECVSFVDTTIAAEAAGGLLCVVTLGASEVMAQGAVVLAATRAAQAIRAAVDALAGVAVAAAFDLDVAATRLAALSAQMRPTLARTVQESAVVRPGVAGQIAPAATTPVEVSLSRFSLATEEYAVGPATQTWADMSKLDDHFRRHGRAFAATSPDDYARKAAAFFLRAKRERLPMKIDRQRATIRFYEPASDTFGAYRFDGKTRSFFKPKNGQRYWAKQAGELVDE